MKRFLILLTIALTCLSLFSSIAEARRFGGGNSFGKQRTMPAQRVQRAPDAAPAQNRNKWLGPLAGLAIGAGLASMFAGNGIGGLGSVLPLLLLAGLVMFLIAKFKQSQQPNMQYVGGAAPYNASAPMSQSIYSESAIPVMNSIPQGFPIDSFLRNAKASFIRLQAANDRKDINDVREYTTPEIFAEISMQMQERGNVVQRTDVIAIDAELLEVANEGDFTIASVRFTGQLRENDGMPEFVDEIWHVQKNLHQENAPWLLAGIQQKDIH
ncbi:Tim44-like domain protein [mine drainage metagenome]|uniref:Tim44-like domain protein n=1 Tax=mine drainage metagenome TaxID=410659 RepID=A0A1J5TN38_9ZZZZ